jgi:hypothetical protein
MSSGSNNNTSTSPANTLDALQRLASPSACAGDHPYTFPSQTQHMLHQPPPPPQPAPLPSLDVICGTRVATYRYAPKAVRNELSALVPSAYQKVLEDPNNVTSWAYTFLLPKCVLFIPSKGGKGRLKNKVGVIRQRIRSWKEGRQLELWKEATTLPRGKQKPPPTATQAETNTRRTTKLVQDGNFSRAAKALISKGLDFDSAPAQADMRAKHPQVPPPELPSEPTPLPFVITPQQASSALSSFQTGTAPGPSSMRASHFKNAIFDAAPARREQCLNTMTQVLNLLAAGKVPKEVAPFICGANLFAAHKKDGGHRPIAVGETLRRWVSKCLATAAIAETAPYLDPLQLGVGVKGGCEAIIHAMASIFESESTPLDSKWILQVDFDNAFNSIDRETLMKEVRQHVPQLSAWVEFCYATRSHLFFGNERLLSSAGVHQGYPLASLLFVLLLHPVVLKIQAECKSLLLNAWFLDDGILSGAREDLIKALDILVTDGPPRGLHLKPSKSNIWCGDSNVSEDPLQRLIPKSDPSGLIVLGAPVGDITFPRQTVLTRIAKIEAVHRLLPSLNNAQAEFCLLRSCFSLPKFSYCLRTCNPAYLQQTFRGFDHLQRRTLGQLMGQSLTDKAWIQATLPIGMGGIGLRSAEVHSAAAYLASMSQVSSIVSRLLPSTIPLRTTAEAFNLLQRFAENPTWSSLDMLPPDFTQHDLSHAIDIIRAASLRLDAPTRQKALLNSLTLPHAGDWLNVVPSPTLGLHLHTEEFRAAIL